MKAMRYSLVLLCALLSSAASAQAQRAIYGIVRGNDHRDIVPPTFTVRITAVDVGTGRALRSEIFYGQAFGMSLNNNRIVNLVFQSDGYDEYTVPRINTGTDNSSYRVPPVPVTLSRIYGRSLTRAQVGEKLRRARVVAQVTGAIDLFLYNLESYTQVYRDKADVLAEIEKFKAETKATEEFRDLLSPERELKMNTFGKIIQFRSRTISTLDPAQVLDLIKDSSVFPGIRAQAAQAFTDIEARPAKVDAQALEFFRQQAAAGGDLFVPSFTALASIGSDADKAMVLQSITSPDFDRAVAAITAVGDAGLTRGSEAVAARWKSEDDPSLRLVAVSSLKRLAVRHRDEVAAGALRSALANDYDAAARAEAAEGLAGARSSHWIRDVLKDAAVTDESYDVRVTAAGARAVSMSTSNIPAKASIGTTRIKNQF